MATRYTIVRLSARIELLAKSLRPSVLRLTEAGWAKLERVAAGASNGPASHDLPNGPASPDFNSYSEDDILRFLLDEGALSLDDFE
jgi:hypothetical protein